MWYTLHSKEVKGMLMEYNQTSDCKIHKYTINLNIPLYELLKKDANDLGIKEVSTFLKLIIKDYYDRKEPLKPKDIIFGRSESIRLSSAKHRREKLYTEKEGFIKITIRRISDIINPKQHFFDFKK